MRTVLLPLVFLAIACSPPPPCTTGASNLKISDANGGTLHQADAVCADWNTDYLNLVFEVELGGGEKIHGLSVSSRVVPQTVGSFECERSELGADLNVTIEGERSYDYSNLTSYKAGHDPGSQINGTSCTLEVSSAPSSGLAAGTFVGRLGRVQTVGAIELVDVRFTFSAPAK